LRGETQVSKARPGPPTHYSSAPFLSSAASEHAKFSALFPVALKKF
jgi:hypothetical protein